MQIKWYGTATIELSDGTNNLIFDPFEPMNKKLNSFTLYEIESINTILITHGHFDHIKGAIELLKDRDKRVYCSKTATDKLINYGVKENQIITVSSGSTFSIGEMNIRVYNGKHIVFNFNKIIKSLFNKRVIIYRDNLKIISKDNRNFPAEQVLVYEIEHKGKKLLHFGSLNVDEMEVYPRHTDVISIPYQGRSDMSRYLVKFLRKFNTKAIYLQHYDDTFPPVSVQEDIAEMKSVISKAYPNTKIIVPDYYETHEI